MGGIVSLYQTVTEKKLQLFHKDIFIPFVKLMIDEQKDSQEQEQKFRLFLEGKETCESVFQVYLDEEADQYNKKMNQLLQQHEKKLILFEKVIEQQPSEKKNGWIEEYSKQYIDILKIKRDMEIQEEQRKSNFSYKMHFMNQFVHQLQISSLDPPSPDLLIFLEEFKEKLQASSDKQVVRNEYAHKFQTLLLNEIKSAAKHDTL